MALTFEYWRGSEVLGGDTLGGSTMEYWRGGEVYQFFAPDSAAPAAGQPIVMRTATIPHLGGSLRQARF